eukprot:3849488-Rhodomonas_salina.2
MVRICLRASYAMSGTVLASGGYLPTAGAAQVATTPTTARNQIKETAFLDEVGMLALNTGRASEAAGFQ